MTEDQINVKFTALGGDVIGKDRCTKVRQWLMSMDERASAGELLELTRA